MSELLSRDEFRNSVFRRDKGLCVVCKVPAVDAHHIIERRLFPDGGYYLDNGASVCEGHHLEAESTVLSCDELRALCHITGAVLPPHLYPDQPYDKWGNPILPNGQRLMGDLFNDESVRKVIKPVLHLFTGRVKYPRTYHLPWSPSPSSDDRVMADLSGLTGPLVATIKMDGENTTCYRDYLHARSLEYESHPSRDRMKAFHAQWAHEIPEGWRICGENLYARHSIAYLNLHHFFQVFSIWNDKNVCLSWEDTVEWCALLGLHHVPVMARFEGELPQGTTPPSTHHGDAVEGFVVRVARAFNYGEFRKVVGKWVRKNHVQTHGHWMRQAVVPNVWGES